MPRRPRAARGVAPLELGDLCEVRAHGLRVAQVARRREATDEPAAAAALLLRASGREDAADPAAREDELVGRTVGERVHLVRVRVRVRVRSARWLELGLGLGLTLTLTLTLTTLRI